MDRIHSSRETEEPINASGKRKRWSDVWAHFEEMEICSKNSDGVPTKVVKVKCKHCKQCFTKSNGGTTSTLKRHIKERCPPTHPREVHPSGETEEPINANWNKRKRSDVWAHFEEVEISSKNSYGVSIKVVKIKCKGCKQCFTKSKCGTTSTLKRHIKERCLHTHLREVYSQDMGRLEVSETNKIAEKTSGVWTQVEEVVVSSESEDMVRLEVSEINKIAEKTSGVWTQVEEVGISSQSEDKVILKVSETNKTAEKGGTRKRSGVWTQFEEVAVSEKTQKGLNLKVKKLQCKKCKRLFTKSKDGSTTSLKRHIEETCAIRNGQRSLLDYCVGS